jgi:hypothetical protein
MPTRQSLLMVCAVSLGGLLPGQAGAQDLANEILYTRFRDFSIPVVVEQRQPPLKQMQLFVSTDQGRTWQPNTIATPEQKRFRFICDRDGAYWFTVQTLDMTGRYLPPTLDRVQASLKVVVDTERPVVHLRPLGGRAGEVGVTWEAKDDNLDLRQPDAFRLEYRPVGGVAWLPLAADPGAAQHFWNPQTSAPLEVRLTVRDRAGNVGEAITNAIVGQQDGGQPFSPPGGGAGVSNGFAAPADRRLVNSKRISLNYELKDVGPSGVSAVELWFTQDGRSWNRYPLPKAEEGARPPRPLVFDVAGEGVYGFTLVAKSGVGLGERPPQVGDRPQVWVEVDLTKPVVQVQQVLVGRGADQGKLTITWSARDRNLGRDPITLSYAEGAGGPWRPLATKIANTGRYVWSMPDKVPYQFYVRVEAADLAGNVGEATTPDMIRVDLSQPRVNILNVEPVGR